MHSFRPVAFRCEVLLVQFVSKDTKRGVLDVQAPPVIRRPDRHSATTDPLSAPALCAFYSRYDYFLNHFPNWSLALNVLRMYFVPVVIRTLPITLTFGPSSFLSRKLLFRSSIRTDSLDSSASAIASYPAPISEHYRIST